MSADGLYENFRNFPSDGQLDLVAYHKARACPSDCTPMDMAQGVGLAERDGPTADKLAAGEPCLTMASCRGKRFLTEVEVAGFRATGVPMPSKVCDVILTVIPDSI